MKRITKIILFFIAIAAAVLLLLNLVLFLFANRIIVSQLEKNLRMKVSLKGVNITPPLSVNLDSLQVEDLFKADRISISPSLLGLLTGKIVLSSVVLVNPVITLEQSREGKLNIPVVGQGGHPPAVYITRLIVREGKLIFLDKKVDPSGFKIILDKMNIDIAKIMFPPTSLKATFKATADLLKAAESKIGEASFLGWVDFGPKDADATITLKDLDAAYFYPYYGNLISERKITSAKLDLQSRLESKNNDLDIFTDFKLSDIVYEESEEVIPDAPRLDLTKKALDLFTDREGRIILDFHIKTKLDKPEISQEEIKKIILKAAAKNIARQNPEDLIKKVSDNIEQFKDFGKEIQKIFKGKE